MPGKFMPWDFSKQRLRQLQYQLRVKEERIAELETENAILHLKLAEKLQQNVKEFRNSFLVFLQSCQEYQSCLSDITTVVQRVELSSEALRGGEELSSASLVVVSRSPACLPPAALCVPEPCSPTCGKSEADHHAAVSRGDHRVAS